MIGRFLKLGNLVPEVKVLVDWGASNTTVGFSTAVEISRLNRHEQILVATKAVEYGFTRTEAKELLQLRSRSGRDIEDCVREIVAMRPRVERICVFLGKVADEGVRQRLRSLRQEERDQLLSDALERKCPEVLRNISLRLGADSFVLACSDDAAELVQQCFTDLETGITSLLVDEGRTNG